MQIGCYVLHIYCELDSHVPGSSNPGEFTGKNENEALREARKAGWKTGIAGDICPVCLGKSQLENPDRGRGLGD